MKTRYSESLARLLTIRTLVVLWAGSLFFVWVFLVLSWLTASRQLKVYGDRVITDVRALDAARELELAILAHRREDLLWAATGQAYHQARSQADLAQAEGIAAGLDPQATTGEEGELLAEIRAGLTTLRERPTPPDSIEAETQSVYRLLEVVDRFQAQNELQMEESMRAAGRLRATIGRWAFGLLVGTAGLLTVGSLVISRRVVRPVMALTTAARAFGSGDLAARSPILHDDEMGALARTFNNMAGDIADREKDRLHFIAMVVHDLKNPVLAIEMAVRLFRASAEDERQRESCLDAMVSEAKRLRTIVRDLTDDVQVASGHFLVRQEPVDLCALVRRLIQAQAAAFSDHQIVLELPQACTVRGDAGRIERVVMNLVSNAVKYSPRGTRVAVHIEERQGFALLSISDQGRGISAEDAKVIFQPFGRGRSADTLAEGTGMGLYVVKQIVEAHGGKIEVESAPGHGTLFRVELPLASAPVGELSSPTPV